MSERSLPTVYPEVPPVTLSEYQATAPMVDSELALARQQGDHAATERIVRRHMGKLSLEANRIWRKLPFTTMLAYDDIRQDLAEQLLRAADRYEPEKAQGTDSLLVMMKHGPYQQVAQDAWQSYGVRPSERANELARKLYYFKREVYSREYRNPTNSEISLRLGIPIKATRSEEIDVQDVQRVRPLTIDLERFSTLDDLGNSTAFSIKELPLQFDLQRTMAKDPTPTPEDMAVRADYNARIRKFVEHLGDFDAREQQLITLRYGIGGERSQTLIEAAQGMDISVQVARKLETKAYQRLRRWLKDANLAETF